VATITLLLGMLSGPSGALGLTSLVASVLLLGSDARITWQVWQQWYGQHYPASMHRKCRRSGLYDTYGLINVNDDLVLYSPEVNARLDEARNQLAVSQSPFRVTHPALRYREFALRYFRRDKILFDAPKIRLLTDLTPELLDTEGTVTVQPTIYFAGVMTNELAGLVIKSWPDAATVFDGHELICRNGLLSDLRSSDCSNHVGASTLAFTSDGNIPIMPQTRSSARSAGLDAPSGSGSLDWGDLEPGMSLQDCVRAGVARELFEETLDDRPREGIDTILLGFARHLRFGGKPEFYAVSRLDHARFELYLRHRERQYHTSIERVQMDLSSVETLLADLRRVRCGRALSTQLYINVLFLEQFLERYTVSALEWLRGE
jgi:hypothetical protein